MKETIITMFGLFVFALGVILIIISGHTELCICECNCLISNISQEDAVESEALYIDEYIQDNIWEETAEEFNIRHRKELEEKYPPPEECHCYNCSEQEWLDKCGHAPMAAP